MIMQIFHCYTLKRISFGGQYMILWNPMKVYRPSPRLIYAQQAYKTMHWLHQKALMKVFCFQHKNFWLLLCFFSFIIIKAFCFQRKALPFGFFFLSFLFVIFLKMFHPNLMKFSDLSIEIIRQKYSRHCFSRLLRYCGI